jgi:diguanylate cyclase (GGDEF)-like protein
LPFAPGDLVARYGGEELAIILPRAGPEAATGMGQLACEAVRNLEIPHKESSTDAGTLTISVGAATVVWREGGSAEMPHALVASADRALYRAKRNGRDQVATGLVLGASN